MKFMAWSVTPLVVLFAASPLLAQEKPGVQEQAVIDAANADTDLRATLAEELVASKESPGREFQAAFRRMLVERLKKHSVEQLRAELRAGIIAPDAIGDTRADLTYTPLAAPCRIIDTRIAGGALTGGAPGPIRSFKVAGTVGFDTQGGTAGGCGIPLGTTAVLINFTAVNPQGLGNIRGSAYPNAVPTTGSIVNYQALTPNLNVANGLLFSICDPSIATCTQDVTLLANGAGTDVVADVLGYTTRFPKEQLHVFVVTSHSTFTTLIPSTCVSYTNGLVTVNAPVAGTVHVSANVILQWNHGVGNGDEPFVYLTSTNDCSTGLIGLDEWWASITSLPSGTYYPEVHLDGTFPVSAGSNTFYITGTRVGATADSIFFYYSGLTATFVPN